LQNAPSLDHDTKNVTGTPAIADTIQRKIRRCGVFIADLTSVADYTTANERQKQTPNANVMAELGLAIRAVGWERIILVMNTAFGGPDDLPFDLKHHSFPIQYSLKPDGDRKAVFAEFAERIFQKLNPIFESGIIERAAAKKKFMTATVEMVTQAHARYLCVDVVNKAITLNHVRVELIYDGGSFGLKPNVEQMPEPFGPFFSMRFRLMNNEPHQVLKALAESPNETIFIAVYSGVREVVRLPVSQWMTAYASFVDANPNLPAKPIPQAPRIGGNDWIGDTSNWLRGRP
jgi:hypothetical protein